MSDVCAEFEMDPQRGPVIRVTVDGTKIAIYLAQETGVVTPPSNCDQYGIEVKGPWWKFRQYVETPSLPDEVVGLQLLLQCRAQLAAERERVERLRAGYAEAIEDIADWACYASEYFREKHDLRVTLLKHKTILAGAQGEGDE